MIIGGFRLKIRKVNVPINDHDAGWTGWEVFSVNGELLSHPIELGDWLTANAGEMANLGVEPV